MFVTAVLLSFIFGVSIVSTTSQEDLINKKNDGKIVGGSLDFFR